jgi:transposase
MTPLESAEHIATIKSKYIALKEHLNEKSQRLWAAAEAAAIGAGGISRVHQATGISKTTIRSGLRELSIPPEQTSPQARSTENASSRLRRPGGGRKPLQDKDPTLLADLEELLEPDTRGDPESALRWCSKSLHKLKAALHEKGHSISHQSVSTLLSKMGYSLQANKKTKEGSCHPDRNAQFSYVNERTKAMQALGQPVISVDCKKKELVGEFKNAGREWHKKGQPDEVLVYDFVDRGEGKAIPYGIYDVTKNRGFVNVGMDHDTAAFAVASIGLWWERLGKAMYPEASQLQIMADGGGSNSSRSRLWKLCLQELADSTGLTLHVCHFPPGTSKWNKIEHRLFSFISLNWRGRPLVSFEVVVSLIGSVRTQAGLVVDAVLDRGLYPTKIIVSDDELASVRLLGHDFHREWNYTIEPRKR